MAKREWTKRQQTAIGCRDKSLLISAAAGSGKTATLTERVIRSILEGDDPLDVTDLLVVTFTNAAAGELRERITAAVQKALLDDPKNERLQRQLHLLPLARICTIDSFCNEILRQNTAAVHLPPNYRIADTAEAKLLSSTIMETLIEGTYAGVFPEVATPDRFAALADCLSDTRSDKKLGELLLALYEKLSTREDGVSSLVPLIDEYDPEIYAGPEGLSVCKYALAQTHRMIDYYTQVFGKALLPLRSDDDPKSAKYLEVFEPVYEFLVNVKTAETYGAYYRYFSALSFGALPRVQKRTEEQIVAAEIYTAMRAELLDARAKYFLYTEEQYRALSSALYEKLMTLYAFLEKFDCLYTEEKRLRGLCEYSDIERYAYLSLWQGNERTEFAKSLAASFRAVYIDEYQDVNRLQNRIFEAVSTSTNRFMVGDIKQSIYSFRSADPRIFAEKKMTLPPVETADHSPEWALFMSENFRCDKGVVDFVNSVFDKMFTLVGKSIGYVPEDRLIFAKKNESEPPYRRAEVLLVESPPRRLHVDPDTVEEDSLAERESAAMTEARVVAEKIRELLATGEKNDGTPILPCDIAIMLRATKSKGRIYSQALLELGIRSEIAESENFFFSAEILLTLCLLNSIDNPHKDIYLTGLLVSPLFGFVPDDLVAIRLANPDEDVFYRALIRYTEENPDFEKGRVFLDTLDSWRRIAEGMPVDRLLSRLYYETGLLTLAGASGGRDNLMLLFDYARRFEGSGFLGLYSFISYINNLIEKGTRFDNRPEVGADKDAVKIITIHASKGLEYPVCFLCDAGTRFRDKDKGKLSYAEDFGLSLLLRHESGLVSVENPIKNAIDDRRMQLLFEEELRILYVALTRAREQIYVSGSVTNIDRYREALAIGREGLGAYTASRLRSYLDIILYTTPAATLTEYPYLAADQENKPEEDVSLQSGEFELPTHYSDEETCPMDESLRSALRDRFSYCYPDEALTTLPQKLSVSRLSPSALDERERRETDKEKRDPDVLNEKTTKVGMMPEFYSGKMLDEGARRGTATHTVLQFCDMNRLLEKGAEEEIERLVEEQYISKKEASIVRVNEIERFRKSEFIHEILGAKKLYRELRFHVTLPAREFTEDAEKKRALAERRLLVQGVIDCLFEREDGTLVLADYKTDRLTKEELQNPKLARQTLRGKHERQLVYYRDAIREMFGRAPDSVLIYSLPLGEAFEV